jgi:DNA-binding transcriptional ArsR family regulator
MSRPGWSLKRVALGLERLAGERSVLALGGRERAGEDDFLDGAYRSSARSPATTPTGTRSASAGGLPDKTRQDARWCAPSGNLDRQVYACLWSAGVGDVFKALADRTRRAILDELAERDGQTLFELCSRLATKHGLGSTRQAISQHVDLLEGAGLVRTRRDGRYKFHYLDTAPLQHIVERWPISDAKGER